MTATLVAGGLQQAAVVGELGLVELLTVLCHSGDTSLAITFRQTHLNPAVFFAGSYDTAGYASSVTPQGCTLNFANPGADKTIQVLVVG